jgi:hypothetical protein
MPKYSHMESYSIFDLGDGIHIRPSMPLLRKINGTIHGKFKSKPQFYETGFGIQFSTFKNILKYSYFEAGCQVPRAQP